MHSLHKWSEQISIWLVTVGLKLTEIVNLSPTVTNQILICSEDLGPQPPHSKNCPRWNQCNLQVEWRFQVDSSKGQFEVKILTLYRRVPYNVDYLYAKFRNFNHDTAKVGFVGTSAIRTELVSFGSLDAVWRVWTIVVRSKITTLSSILAKPVC